MVVVKPQSSRVYRCVEGPSIRRVLLWQHLFEQPTAVPQLGTQLAFLGELRLDRVGQVLLRRFDGTAAAHPSARPGHHRLQENGTAGAPNEAHARWGLQAHAAHGGDGVHGGVMDLTPVTSFPQAHHVRWSRHANSKTQGGGSCGVRFTLHTFFLHKREPQLCLFLL